MTDKAPDAYRTISEVAEDLDLPQHVLRFWETRFSQIRPLKRGGGRRYYRPDDVELLKGIRYLLYSEGFTIKGVQRILKEQGPKAVQMLVLGPAGAAMAPAPQPHGAEAYHEDEPGEADDEAPDAADA
ncbi:MAG TPA: MerR family transcriptional regulator, partial [Beijerinckiaceae bacterium]|nr:MerR family transcriptional regulator [Beijerinckiaceae bacterium]